MTHFTRLTIVGTSRRADVVVPDDEPIAGIIPRLLRLLEEPSSEQARPLVLARVTGELVSASLSASDQHLDEGEVLRLVREDAAPPPPQVADVTDVLADTRDEQPGRWHDGHRRALAAVGTGILAAAAASGAGPLLDDLLPLAVLPVAAVALAAVVGRLGARWAAAALTALALGVAVPLVTSVPELTETLGTLGTIAGVLTVAWVILGVGVGVGMASVPATAGAAIGAVLSALPLGLARLGLGAPEALGVTGVIAVLTVGVLPWVAMSVSGLTGLDDRVLEGDPRPRSTVIGSIGRAYAALTWAVAAAAAPICLAVVGLFDASSSWAVALAVALVAATALRTRPFPLAGQGWALWAAVGLALVVGLPLQTITADWVPVAVLGALAVVAAGAGGVTPPEYRRASLRRIGDIVEMVAVVATIPLLLGLFGVYPDLLAAFS